MSQFTRMRATANGADLLSKAHEGVPLRLVGIQIGTGAWTEEERTDAPPAALKDKKRSVAITEYEQHEGAVVLKGLLTNAALETGFMMTEIGVTAQHPELGEVLYMADYVPPEMASFLPPASTAPVEVPISITVATGTGTQVVVKIEDRFVSVSKKEMESKLSEHKHDADPHPDMRVAAPSLKLPNGFVSRVNEGESIGFEVSGVPENPLWETEVKLQILNAENEDVTSDFSPQVTNTSVTLTAPQVPADSVFNARFQTWQHGGLASLPSAPIEFTVVDVPVDPPAFTYPANHATGIGETPTLTITPGASDDDTKHHVHTKFVISRDLLRTVVVAESGILGAVTSWQVPAEVLNTNEHLYLHTCTQWGDTWSGWTTIDVFTSDQFQFIQAPTILAPQEGSEVMWSGLKAVIATPVIEEGGTLQLDKIEAEISKDGEVIHTETVNVGQTFVDLPTQERNTALTIRVRVHDAVRGWSVFSEVRAFKTKNIGHGARVDGGIAIGNTDGTPYEFADGESGWLVVIPGSQRRRLAWGLYGKDTRLTNVDTSSDKDGCTGAHNTAVLCSGSYSGFKDGQGSVGSPAATYCSRKIFEGYTDWFLPSKDELKLICQNKAAIDTSDESVSGKLSQLGDNYMWSSSEDLSGSAWERRASTGECSHTYKYSLRWVVPCRRVII